jgi:D-arginine dehydrogenase
MHYDIAIVGAGIAGASLALQLAGRARVVLLEAEHAPGYHATGRSAAFWAESYGGTAIQPLTSASGPWLHAHGFLGARGALTLARAGQEAEAEAFASDFARLGVRTELIGRTALERRLPGLRAGWSVGVYEPDCCDIDVAALHQYCLAAAKAGGAELRCNARLIAAETVAGGWRLELADGRELTAGVLVNAAGAWADEVARIAGAAPIGIAPLRRTVVQLRTAPTAPADLPLVLDLAGEVYFKPEAGRLWLSPHDEEPSAPCDSAPEELAIATAIARFGDVVDWRIEAVERSWAGLRSFAPDRLPVYGFAPDRPGFFWCAGQGGFGIQTAPSASDLAARLLLGDAPGEIDPWPYRASRFC